MNIPLTQLKLAFPHKFPLYQTLLHNAQILHQYSTGSISMPDRPDVVRFANFCKPHLRGVVLDVGIGPLPVPGYYKGAEDFELIGIDVVAYYDTEHILEACAEFLPFQNEYFDTIIFGGSLNHLCDMARSLHETYRVLKPDGNVLVWLSDQSNIKTQGIVEIAGVYYCTPPGAISPFTMRHMNTETVINKFNFVKFELNEKSIKTKSEIFLRFKK